MLCSWHTTLHYCISQLMFSPTLWRLLRPPADNTSTFYHCVICSAIWSQMNVTFELAQTLYTHKNTFFSSPQGCVGVIIILQKVLSNSWVCKEWEVSKMSRLLVLLFFADSCDAHLRQFLPMVYAWDPIFISHVIAAQTAKIYLYDRLYKLSYILIRWPTSHLF